MRYNTVSKRKKYRTMMIRWLITQGYMYKNSADEIADTWVEKGLAGFKEKSIVWDSVRMGMLSITWTKKKNGSIFL